MYSIHKFFIYFFYIYTFMYSTRKAFYVCSVSLLNVCEKPNNRYSHLPRVCKTCMQIQPDKWGL